MGGLLRVPEHESSIFCHLEAHNEDRAVTVTPADRGRRLLMRHEAQERGSTVFPESHQRRGVRQVAADDFSGPPLSTRSRRELVDAVL